MWSQPIADTTLQRRTETSSNWVRCNRGSSSPNPDRINEAPSARSARGSVDPGQALHAHLSANLALSSMRGWLTLELRGELIQ
jgi:hypothetical protein